ncbi:MAG: hypothetical protein NVS4B3_07810 [Gemmatimonadaceae bacterium]
MHLAVTCLTPIRALLSFTTTDLSAPRGRGRSYPIDRFNRDRAPDIDPAIAEYPRYAGP